MITTIYDYIPELLKKFPYLSLKELEKILFRGFRIFSYAMTKGISFTGGTGKGSSFRYFIGTVISAAESLTTLYSGLIFKKMKFLSSLFRIPFNGKYYIGLSDEKHKEILALGLEKTFTDIEAYKYRFCIPLIKGKHIWEVSLEDGPVRIQLEKLITTKAICLDGTSV